MRLLMLLALLGAMLAGCGTGEGISGVGSAARVAPATHADATQWASLPPRVGNSTAGPAALASATPTVEGKAAPTTVLTPVGTAGAQDEPSAASIAVYEFGRVKRFGSGSAVTVRLAKALERELGRGIRDVEETKRHPEIVQEYVERVKRGRPVGDVELEGIEITYPGPGVRVGDRHYARVFAVHRVDTTAEYTPVRLMLGDRRRYDRAVYLGMPPTAPLRTALDIAFLHPPERTPQTESSRKDKERLGEVAEAFLEAAIRWAQSRGDAVAAGEYESVARAHLAPELAVRTLDLGRLGLLLPSNERDAAQVGGVRRTWRISGDRATINSGVMLILHDEPMRRQCVRLALEHTNGWWRIAGIETSEPEGDYTCGKNP